MIGIFDSGFGGLSFAKELNKLLPAYDFMYLGDQLRVPYGGRSAEAIKRFTKEGVSYLWNHGAELVIVACNTASAEALRYIQQEVQPEFTGKKSLGILIPAVESALEENGHIGIIATKATVSIGAYPREILQRDSERKVFQVSAPLSVPFIEEGLGKSPEHKKILKKYLRPLKDAKVKSLILGCTHYPHVENLYQKIMGPQVKIINSGKEAAHKLQDYLKRHPEVESTLGKSGKREYLTTDCPQYFSEQGSLFYGEKITAKKIDLT